VFEAATSIAPVCSVLLLSLVFSAQLPRPFPVPEVLQHLKKYSVQSSRSRQILQRIAGKYASSYLPQV